MSHDGSLDYRSGSGVGHVGGVAAPVGRHVADGSDASLDVSAAVYRGRVRRAARARQLATRPRARRAERLGEGPARLDFLDAARGFAVALMVLDHAIHVVGLPEGLRLGVTRLALPVFMVLSGALLSARSFRLRGRRVVELAAAVLLSTPATVIADLDRVNVLAVYAVGVAVMFALARVPVPYWVTVAVCFTTLQFLRFGWNGYEPAIVVGLLALGAQVGVGVFRRTPDSWAWVRFLGRHALVVFVVQSWLFAALSGVLS